MKHGCHFAQPLARRLQLFPDQCFSKRTEQGEARASWSIDGRMGYVCATRTVSEVDELLVTTKKVGVIIRIPANGVQVQGRATQGMCIMNVEQGDEVAAVARITWISCRRQ